VSGPSPLKGGPCSSSSNPSAAQAVRDWVPRRRLEGWGKAVVVGGCATTVGFLALPRLHLPPPPFGERPRTSLETSLLAVQASGALCRRP